MKIIISLFISFFSILILNAQPPRGDIGVANLNIVPAPAVVNGTGVLSFTVFYNTQFPIGASLQGYGPFTIATDPLQATVTLTNVVPQDLVNPNSMVTITGDGAPTATYNVGDNTYTISQTAPIPDGGGFTVEIPIRHIAASIASDPRNGFNLNLERPGYFTDNPLTNNSGFTYTYTTGVLPVRLLSFTGATKDCENILSWKSSQEKNAKSIEVERSENGADFKKVGNLPAKGGANDNSYNFTDQPLAAKSFYRLKITDIDGKYIYSDVITVSSKCYEPQASIYPNPVSITADANIILKNFTGKIAGYLQDISGKQLQVLTLQNGSNRVQLSRYSAGTYLLKVIDENNNTSSLKVVLAR